MPWVPLAVRITIGVSPCWKNSVAWSSDLWDASFWRMNLTTLSPDKLAWLLKSCSASCKRRRSLS